MVAIDVKAALRALEKLGGYGMLEKKGEGVLNGAIRKIKGLMLLFYVDSGRRNLQ